MNRYFEQQIIAADQLELVRLLYQHATSSVRDARAHLRTGRIAERERAISSAYATLNELACSLRREAAPDLVGRLHDLYCYMQSQLLAAMFQQADEPLANVLGLLVTLGEAWNGIQFGERSQEEQRPGDGGSWNAYSLPSEPGQIAVSV